MGSRGNGMGTGLIRASCRGKTEEGRNIRRAHPVHETSVWVHGYADSVEQHQRSQDADGGFPPRTLAGRHAVWHELMGVALHEATDALSTGDVPVGAVVVGPDGRVLGTGRNRREETGDPTAHAEVLALREAAAARGGWRLDGCTLVVTLEPCVMCAGALVAARVDRLVLGAWDPKAGASGSVWDLVRDQRGLHAVEVISGVRADECGAVLREFFAPRR